MLLFGEFEPVLYQFEFRFRSFDSSLGFLLERVQHVHGIEPSYRANGSIRVAIVIIGNFDNS